MTDEKKQTYAFVCFCDLAYEFDLSEKKETEKKIKQKLKYHKLGDYDQEKVDYIRKIKNDLQTEISLGAKSTYFHKSESNYSDLADFDSERLSADLAKKYSNVNEKELMGFINFAIYLYHMR